MREWGPVTSLIVASVAWGLSWMPFKHFGALGVGGVPLTLVAYGAGALVMLPFLRRGVGPGEGRYLVAIALLGGYANLAFAVAMVYGEVVRVMVLFYLLPVWGVLGGRVFLGEPIDGLRWTALGLAVAGAFLVLGGPEAFAGRVSWPDVLALTCGIAFSLNNVVFRARQALPLGSKVSAMFGGCALLAALLIAAGVQPWPEVATATWGLVAGLGVGWLLLATLGTMWGVTHMETGRASILIILELLTAVASATLIGGETMAPAEWAGAALILSAAVLEGRRPVSA
ncbi:MAG: DMT family transporter [Gammaproteobacteria bacterium]|nr:DMT family transporter [Gammaproteobacteria bacterium]